MTPDNFIIYDNNGFPEKIQIDKCVAYINDTLHIKTINHIMYFYVNGVYIDGAEDIVRELLTRSFFNITTVSEDPIINKTKQNEIIYKLGTLTITSLRDFDKNIAIINMVNGLYNWQTGELTDHTPEYLSLIQIPVTYDPVAKCPVIIEVLKDIVDERYYTLSLEFIAYLLYRGYDIQKAVILYGPGMTGKSWFLDLCKSFVGANNCSNESFQDLGGDKFKGANLFMKLLNECGDLDGDPLSKTGTFKKLTSKDVISVQKKNKDSYNMINFAKLLFATNILPPTKDKTTGFSRRVIIIPFLRVFKPEEFSEIRDKANSDPVELSGLFNLVIPLLKPLMERMKFTREPSPTEIQELYQSISDPKTVFLDSFISEDSKVSKITAGKKLIYACLKLFCKHGNAEIPTEREWNAFLKKNWISLRTYEKQLAYYKTTIDKVEQYYIPDTKFDIEKYKIHMYEAFGLILDKLPVA